MKLTRNGNVTKEATRELKPTIYEKHDLYTDNKGRVLRLAKMSWHGEDELNAKWDLRWWWMSEDGEERCGKGVSMNDDSLIALTEFCKGIEVEE